MNPQEEWTLGAKQEIYRLMEELTAKSRNPFRLQ